MTLTPLIQNMTHAAYWGADNDAVKTVLDELGGCAEQGMLASLLKRNPPCDWFCKEITRAERLVSFCNKMSLFFGNEYDKRLLLRAAKFANYLMSKPSKACGCK